MAADNLTVSDPIFRLPLIKEIARTQRVLAGWTLIRDDDFARQLLECPWYLMKIGYAGGRFPDGKGKEILTLHRLVFEHYNGPIADGLLIDHADRNKLNNLPSNLRAVSSALNRVNAGMLKNNTSGFKGVSWSKKEQRWIAVVWLNGKSHRLGSHKDKRLAADAVNDAYCRFYPNVPPPNPR